MGLSGLNAASELAGGDDCRDSIADCQLARCGHEFAGLGTAGDRITSSEHFERAEGIERRSRKIELLFGRDRSLPNRAPQSNVEFVESCHFIMHTLERPSENSS